MNLALPQPWRNFTVSNASLLIVLPVYQGVSGDPESNYTGGSMFRSFDLEGALLEIGN